MVKNRKRQEERWYGCVYIRLWVVNFCDMEICIDTKFEGKKKKKYVVNLLGRHANYIGRMGKRNDTEFACTSLMEERDGALLSLVSLSRPKTLSLSYFFFSFFCHTLILSSPAAAAVIPIPYITIQILLLLLLLYFILKFIYSHWKIVLWMLYNRPWIWY